MITQHFDALDILAIRLCCVFLAIIVVVCIIEARAQRHHRRRTAGSYRTREDPRDSMRTFIRMHTR